MQFCENQLFHIYNQGNNQRQVFFTDENYHFFLWKMRGYLLPFGDLIAWCLMPNHFHWQFFVKEIAIKRKVLREHVDAVEYQRRVKKAIDYEWSSAKDYAGLRKGSLCNLEMGRRILNFL